MKMIGAGVVAVMVGIMCSSCSPAKGPDGAVKGAAQKTVAAQKAFAPGMGGLTIKALTAKGAPASLRIKAFQAAEERMSVYRVAFASNAPQILPAGTYDMVIESAPQRMYKGITVAAGKETVMDLGPLTGSVVVKANAGKQKGALYPVRIMQAGTKTLVAATVANRPVDVGPGMYDLEIGTVPVLVKKGVRIDAGKEAAIDIGMPTGSLLVRSADEAKAEVRLPVRIKTAGTMQVIAAGVTGRPLELLEGAYDIDLGSTPAQYKKDVQVKSASETPVDFVVQAAPAKSLLPAKVPAAALKK